MEVSESEEDQAQVQPSNDDNLQKQPEQEEEENACKCERCQVPCSPPVHMTQQGYYPQTKVVEMPGVIVGHSLGIGYPSLCCIPDELYQESYQSQPEGIIE